MLPHNMLSLSAVIILPSLISATHVTTHNPASWCDVEKNNNWQPGNLSIACFWEKKDDGTLKLEIEGSRFLIETEDKVSKVDIGASKSCMATENADKPGLVIADSACEATQPGTYGGQWSDQTMLYNFNKTIAENCAAQSNILPAGGFTNGGTPQTPDSQLDFSGLYDHSYRLRWTSTGTTPADNFENCLTAAVKAMFECSVYQVVFVKQKDGKTPVNSADWTKGHCAEKNKIFT